MPFANDGGVELWYALSGAGEPLVLSGGFGLLDDQFAKIRPLLTPQLQVIDWHYRGAGRGRAAIPSTAGLTTWPWFSTMSVSPPCTCGAPQPVLR